MFYTKPGVRKVSGYMGFPGRTDRRNNAVNPVRKVSETVSLPFADGHPNKPTYSTGSMHPYTVKVPYIYK
jgi:hypothetical protein